MRQILPTSHRQRASITILLALVMLLMPFTGLAQDATPAAPDVAAAPEIPAAPVVPAPGGLQITLTGSTGVGLSGAFAVSDGAGGYQEVWVGQGFGTTGNLAAGTATVTQISGTTDFAVDGISRYVEIPAGGIASASFTNAFLDADTDGVGNSVDVCPAGNDAIDTDLDGAADACDATPNGELPTAVPTLEPTAAPTLEPTAAPTEEVAALSVEVADEPVIVADAPVSCQQADAVSPWIKSDLGDYPPGAQVTLSGGSWVPGQVVEILVEDDGIADAEQGVWTHSATVTTDASGNLTYVFTIAPWYVANYTVVATGECAKAETSFTDSVLPGGTGCTQVVGFSDVLPSANSYVVYLCGNDRNPIKLNAEFLLGSSGWQWTHVFSNDTSTVPTPVENNWTADTLAITEASGNIKFAYVYLRPATAAPGSTGTLKVSVTSPNGNTIRANATLTAYRLPSSTDFKLECQDETVTVEMNQTGTVTCTLSSSSLATGAEVTTAPPTITAPKDWTSGTVSISPGATATKVEGVDTLFTFTIPVTPSGCSAETGAVNVSTALSFQGTSIGNVTAAPTSTVALDLSGLITTSIIDAETSMSWSRPYSLTAYQTSGSLKYQVDVQGSGCGGWNIQVSASDFTRDGGGDPIPASNLTLASTTDPGVTGISRPSTSGSLAAPVKVLSADTTVPTGTYSQTLNLNMNIPGGTIVGSYTSIVTVTAAVGP